MNIKTTDPRITGEAWKTQDRKAVEAVLHSAAATGSALTPQQISSYSNVELSAARAIIKTLVTAKFAINIGTVAAADSAEQSSGLSLDSDKPLEGGVCDMSTGCEACQ